MQVFLRGHARYLDSCISTAWAISASTIGFIYLRLAQRRLAAVQRYSDSRAVRIVTAFQTLDQPFGILQIAGINWLSPSLRALLHIEA